MVVLAVISCFELLSGQPHSGFFTINLVLRDHPVAPGTPHPTVVFQAPSTQPQLISPGSLASNDPSEGDGLEAFVSVIQSLADPTCNNQGDPICASYQNRKA